MHTQYIMEQKSTSITSLLHQIRTALRKDWRMQRKKGQREFGPSMRELDKRIHEVYPDDASENFLKTIDVYNRRGEGLEIGRLRLLLEFLFVHESTEAGWPEVVQTVKSFENGRFSPLVEKYLDSSAINVSDYLHEYALVRAGASPNIDLHTQLIQLASIAKADSRRDKQTIATMAQETERLKSLLSSEKEVNIELKKIIKSIKTRLSAIKDGQEKDKLTNLLRLTIQDLKKIDD